ALAPAVVEVDDAERLAARDEGQREDAPELERVDAGVEVAEGREGVGGDDRLAGVEGAPGDRLREGELVARQVPAGEVARGARDEAAVGRAQEEDAALDA